MGAKSSKTVELSNFISNEIVMDTYMSVTNSGKQEITASNKLVFKCPPEQVVYDFILQLADKDLPPNVKGSLANRALEMRENLCTIRDSTFTQENMIAATQRLEQIDVTTQEIQQAAQASIDQSQEKISDFLSNMVQNTFDNLFGADREENTKLLNDFQNSVKNSLTKETMNELHQNILAQNDLFVESTAMSGVKVTQTNAVTAIQDLLSENALVQNLGQELDAKVQQSAREEEKGLAAIFEALANLLAGPFGIVLIVAAAALIGIVILNKLRRRRD